VNHIFLSASSLAKAMNQWEIEYAEDLPVIGKVRVSLREVRIGDNQIIVPVHTHVPLANKFDVVLTDFRSNGTKAIARMDHAGVIPSALSSVVGCVVESLFGKALKRAAVTVVGDQVTIDFCNYLPPFLKDINVTSMVVRDGIDMNFDY
jgi:hypothetical protein